jgi:eukaryotic-like serine/threonine-protein kinase
MKTEGIFQFGEGFQVDALARTLRREDEVVTLNRRAFDVLLYLVQNPGRVLSRDELLKNVWPDAFVDESSLVQSIYVLRRALTEKPGDNNYIVTLPGRGYQFISPVKVTAPESLSVVPGGTTEASNSSGGIVFQQRTIRTSVITQEDKRKSSIVFGSRFARMLAGIAATLVVSVAILGGMWYWRSLRAPKLAETDTIVVADLDNRTGDPALDDTLREALKVDLDQSPYLNVVPDQKISEALKLMSRNPGQRLTGEMARELCQRVSGNALLQGSIANLGSEYVVVLRVTNCATGDSLASEQARAESKEKILPSLDEAASGLRGKLGESLGSIKKYDTPVEQASTPSLAALQAYSAGVKAWVDRGDEAAIPFYKRAIELDPNFAMAYAHLGTAYNDIGMDEPAAENCKKAFELRDRVSERERLYIDSRYYMIATGEEDKAVAVLEQWRQLYPREARPAYMLALRYRFLGRYEKSLLEAREAVRLEPGADLNYEVLAPAALAMNRFEEAQAALQARHSDTYFQVADQYLLSFLNGDSAGMEKQAARMPSDDGDYLSLQSDTEAYHGRLRKAREFTRRAVEAEVGNKEDAGVWPAELEVEGALQEVELGYPQQAQRDVYAALALSRGWPGVHLHAALALALAGDTGRAETIAAELAKRYPLDKIVNMYWVPTIRAAIQLDQNNPAKAVEYLQVASRYELGGGDLKFPLFPVYVRGQAFLAMHQGAEAAAEFQKYIDHRGAVGNYPLGALARLGLARAYALQGDTRKASAAYQEFFSLWKDADADIPILKQAKAEYAGLP